MHDYRKFGHRSRDYKELQEFTSSTMPSTGKKIRQSNELLYRSITANSQLFVKHEMRPKVVPVQSERSYSSLCLVPNTGISSYLFCNPTKPLLDRLAYKEANWLKKKHAITNLKA